MKISAAFNQKISWLTEILPTLQVIKQLHREVNFHITFTLNKSDLVVCVPSKAPFECSLIHSSFTSDAFPDTTTLSVVITYEQRLKNKICDTLNHSYQVI